MWSKVWNDPVWSKVIAVAIVAAATALWVTLTSTQGPALVKAHEGVAYWILVALAAFNLLSIALAFRRRANRIVGEPSAPTPKASIALVDTRVSEGDAAKLRYPLKIEAEFRNDSPRCVEVNIVKYTEQNVPLEKLALDVIYVKLGSDWCPSQDGVDRVAVLPGQRFRIWLGIAKARFTSADPVRHLLGNAGTLVLAVDGQHCDYKL